MALSCSIGRGGFPLGMPWAWFGSGDGCSAVAFCGLGAWDPAHDRIHAFVSSLVFFTVYRLVARVALLESFSLLVMSVLDFLCMGTCLMYQMGSSVMGVLLVLPPDGTSASHESLFYI